MVALRFEVYLYRPLVYAAQIARKNHDMKIHDLFSAPSFRRRRPVCSPLFLIVINV